MSCALQPNESAMSVAVSEATYYGAAEVCTPPYDRNMEP